MSVLKLDQQFPFSASLVFEQSYGEVDGDSASLAEGIAFISALTNKPINQKTAVTSSVDQFGYVQSVSNVNEKIERFFALCQKRELTSSKGVILPATNIRHLYLHDDVIEAVFNGKFSFWPYIQAFSRQYARVPPIHLHERQRFSWGFRWLNWFN